MCTSYVGFECTHVYIDVCVYIYSYIYIHNVENNLLAHPWIGNQSAERQTN